MKIRFRFVSNSSSTSFIITVQNEKERGAVEFLISYLRRWELEKGRHVCEMIQTGENTYSIEDLDEDLPYWIEDLIDECFTDFQRKVN